MRRFNPKQEIDRDLGTRKANANLAVKFSLIISTKGRTQELIRLFQSLRKQTMQDFEIILSDQNEDDRLIPVIEESGLKKKIIYRKSSGGLSKGRNHGMSWSSGEILSFPDDDCVYSPSLLEEVSAFFQTHPQYGYLSGRSFADDGGDSVSRHSKSAAPIRKMTVLTQCIEFALFFRRSQLGNLRFDEQMGVGTSSPWQSDEGPDFLLRLERKGVRGYYDPRFAVWHPRPITGYSDKDIDRTYRYSCGNGYFYRKHNYPTWFFAYHMARALCGLLLALLTFHFGKARLYLARLRGRWRGWKSSPISNQITPST
jgi:glycosyltransferase involved in cell wall biosynthesis